jgi:hypothetical protein
MVVAYTALLQLEHSLRFQYVVDAAWVWWKPACSIGHGCYILDTRHLISRALLLPTPILHPQCRSDVHMLAHHLLLRAAVAKAQAESTHFLYHACGSAAEQSTSA